GRPPGQDRRIRPVVRGLGCCRIESAERDIVGARLTGFHREMAAVVAGPPDLGARPEQRPSLAKVAIRLADMNAVRAETLRQLHAVVDDEGDLGIGADALKRLSKACQLMLVEVLYAQLEGRRDPWFQRRLEPVRKTAANLLRADQVEFRWLRPPARRKLDRIEFGFVQGQAGTFSVEAS